MAGDRELDASAGGTAPGTAADRARSREAALRLMRLALPLLDEAGQDVAAARLQHAIDTATAS